MTSVPPKQSPSEQPAQPEESSAGSPIQRVSDPSGVKRPKRSAKKRVDEKPGIPELDPASGAEEIATQVAAATIATTFVEAAAVTETKAKKRSGRHSTRRTARPQRPAALEIDGLVKKFGDTTVIDAISLRVTQGSLYGLVGPNGAGKTTTLSMIAGLVRPTSGTVKLCGVDVWAEPQEAKKNMGVLPDRLRLFDQLTGEQFLYYAATLRGLDPVTTRSRTADLVSILGLTDALGRLVCDYSAGMAKKIALAAALIHAPRLLILDEPFESIDPVSAANIGDMLRAYVAGGGTAVISSHGMNLVESLCDGVAVVVKGKVLASGTLDEVRGKNTLEERFVELTGGRKLGEEMEWLHSFST